MIEQDAFMVLTPELLFLLIAIMIWSAVWKAIAMWHAARNKQVAWFVVLCLFNTIGLLEVLYLGLWQRDKNTKPIVKVVAAPAKKAARKK